MGPDAALTLNRSVSRRCGPSYNLQEEEALCSLLDQLLGNVLGVKPGPELNQQRVVPLHILGCHL